MPELQQYEVNVFPNCKESLYVTAEFPPYCRSNSIKASNLPQMPVNQVASKPILPQQLIPMPLKPSKPLNHKLALSSSGQSTPVTNVASKPIVSAESSHVSSSKKQRRIYSNLSDLKLSPSTSSSSSPLYEYRNGIQYELAPVEYLDKTITPSPSDSSSPTTSGPTLSDSKKSEFVTQVASKPIHPAQLCPRPLSTPPIVSGAAPIVPIAGSIVNPGVADVASFPLVTSGALANAGLACSGRTLSTPPPIFPGAGIPYGVSGLPLRPAVGVSPFITRDNNCGFQALGTHIGLPFNAACRAPAVNSPIGLLPRAVGLTCPPPLCARSFPIQTPSLAPRAPLPIVPLSQARCAVGAVPSLQTCLPPPCPAPCPRPIPCPLPCPPPCPPPACPPPCPPNNNFVLDGCEDNNQPECSGSYKLGKLCRGCCKSTKVYLGPPVVRMPCRRFC